MSATNLPINCFPFRITPSSSLLSPTRADAYYPFSPAAIASSLTRQSTARDHEAATPPRATPLTAAMPPPAPHTVAGDVTASPPPPPLAGPHTVFATTASPTHSTPPAVCAAAEAETAQQAVPGDRGVFDIGRMWAASLAKDVFTFE